jgi:hypothetical protein
LSRPWYSLWLNSSRANADLDGAVWQGKGATIALTGGARLRAHFIDVSLRPVGFAAQNLGYSPTVGSAAPDDYRDPVFGNIMDTPFRFGRRAYRRIDPGESWVRFGGSRLSGGFATSPQVWGPAHVYPLQMNAEAGGYPRVFVQMNRVPMAIGRVTAEYTVGRLESSGLDELPSGRRSRIVPTLLVSFSPTFMPGLDVGATRVFHVRWEDEALTWSTVGLPFQGLLKNGNPTHETSTLDYNQTATIFARIAPLGSGVEVYGEYYREDHNVDRRDLAVEPDHGSAYTLGVRRAWRAGDWVRAFTWEVANGRITHLATVRSQGPIYTHGVMREGHTYLGQELGSSALPGGGGFTVMLNSIANAMSWYAIAELRRTAQATSGPLDPPASEGWQGRQTGFYQLRFGRTLAHGLRGSRGVSVSAQQGFGSDRTTNFRAQISLQ